MHVTVNIVVLNSKDDSSLDNTTHGMRFELHSGVDDV